jgi:hypothetical protein
MSEVSRRLKAEATCPLGVVAVAGSSGDSVIETIRDKLARGLLPTELPLNLWVSRGKGRACDGCGLPIGPPRIEHEFDFANGRIVRFHEACTVTWRRLVISLADGDRRPGAPGGDTIVAE